MLGRKFSPHGTLIAAMVALAFVSGCDRATTSPVSGEGNLFAARVFSQSGDNQTGPSNGALFSPIAVRVTDAGGQAVRGATIQFVVRQGGGFVSPANAVSDSIGVASTVWTLGSTIGSQEIVALLNNGADSVVFVAVATSGTAAHIVVVSGNGQVGRSDQMLTSPLIVQVTDASGKPLAGASVVFTEAATNPDGFTSSNPVSTGPDGTASVNWTLGQNSSNTTVPMSVVAAIAGVPAASVTFSATARPEYRIRREITPFLQSDTTGATLGAPGDYLAGARDTLRVQVFDPTDSSGVQGVVVTWAALTVGDGHLINATSVTDNRGIAKTLWVLIADAGGAVVPTNLAHRVTATASMGSVEFQARVTAGRICSVLQDPIAGPTTINTAVNITATVTDCNGFPVPGAQVTFAPTAGGVSPTVQFSNAAGKVFTTWTLGGTTGVQKLFATASAQADPYLGVAFPTFTVSTVQSVTVTPLPPTAILQTSAALPGTAVAGSVHSVTFHVTDATGAGVSGQAVTFTATGGGSVTPSGLTDANGDITVTWTLGAAASGAQTMTATAGTGGPTTTVNGGTVP